MMVLGDFSQGSSKDRKVDLDERNLRSLNGSNINEIMKDMGVEVDMVVQDKINPSGQDMRVQLKLENLNSFSPEEVAKQVPQIRSLLLLKKLLEEIQSNVANKKEFAALLNKLFSSDALLQQMREKLQNFSNYRIPNKQLALEGSKSIEIGGEQL
jgi:type VI secretion system protein ImpB